MSGLEDLRGPGIMWDIQRYLSKGQAIPLLGPALVSPLKAVVSLVELVVGFIFAVIFAILTALTLCLTNKDLSNGLGKNAFTAATHSALGLVSFGYAVANMLSLGILGYILENPCDSKNLAQHNL